MDGLDKFIEAVDRAANGSFEDQVSIWLEAMGMEFLDVVQDEIINTGTTDTRRLLNSFRKGDKDNAWSITRGGLTLEVGTNVHYASFANDGHFAIDISSGKDRRWIPGRWKNNGSFEYDPNSDTGMLLGQQWVDGSGYWDNALAIFNKMFERSLDKKLQKWLDEFF